MTFRHFVSLKFLTPTEKVLDYCVGKSILPYRQIENCSDVLRNRPLLICFTVFPNQYVADQVSTFSIKILMNLLSQLQSPSSFLQLLFFLCTFQSYCVFQRFVHAKFANGGSILSSGQLLLQPSCLKI